MAMAEKKLKEAVVRFAVPPKIVYDQQGKMVEVILSYQDYKTFLRALAAHADWEELPPYLQDAVDEMLADEAREEQGDKPMTPLAEALVELGIEPEEDVTA
jgi:hypothetical protein